MATSSNSQTYQVLARRYRPQVFTDVIGQKAVVQQLHNEIREGRVGHGYLFCGPRGTGKTSMARIFAKALNCVNGPTVEPCGKCSHCQEIAAGTHLDIIEVDAATYTKADDTKGLLEGLRRSPFSARTKVYIIDEVHMLSTHSFNALLKSLEEPPANVVFVLATTNPEKIPETVISRCRRCNFDRIHMDDIVRSLGGILATEHVRIDEAERQAILGAIALASDGGLRDAQVMLDQLISLSSEELKLDTVRSLLGVVEVDLFERMLAAIVRHETRECLLMVGDLVDRGRDLQRFAKMFLGFLRDAVLVKAGAPQELLRLVDARAEAFRAVLDQTTLPFLLNVTQQFLDLEERMRGSAPPRFLLEFALIKLTAIDPRLVIDPELGGRSSGADTSRAGSARTPAAPSPAGGARASVSAPVMGTRPAQATMAAAPMMNESAVTTAEASAPVAAAIEAIHTTDADRWRAFVDMIGLTNGAVRGVLNSARLRDVTSSKLTIELAARDRMIGKHLDRPETVAALRECAKKIWGRQMMVGFTIEEAPVAAPVQVELAVPEDAGWWPTEDPDGNSVQVAAEAPTMAQTQEKAKPQPAKETMGPALTFAEARKQFPEFHAACELVESHFGIKAFAYGGKKLEAKG